MQDISVDIEALGTAYNAPILSIGAVLFDRQTGKLGTTFYQEITIASSVKAGLLDGATLAWWLSPARRSVAERMFADDNPDNPRKMHLASALQNFCTWVRSAGEGPCRVYGNGATFDITIIEHAIHMGSVGLSAPWHYTNVRDLRTLVDAAESIAGFDKASVPKVGTAHNALDDAIYQANLTHACWAALGGGKPLGAKTKATVKSITPPAPAPAVADEW